MGIDVYMQWKGITKEDKEKQYTGFIDSGETGYLRGAYFGGYSDVLRFLFKDNSWEEPFEFDIEKFEENLNELKSVNGERPGRGKWDHTKGSERGWDLSERQNELIESEDYEQYEAFLALGRRLKAENKEPKVYISY